MSHTFKVGQRVVWTDPDPDGNGGPGVIVHVQHDDDDAVIALKMDDGGEVEALPHELREVK